MGQAMLEGEDAEEETEFDALDLHAILEALVSLEPKSPEQAAYIDSLAVKIRDALAQARS